jgi:hypothetical protein
VLVADRPGGDVALALGVALAHALALDVALDLDLDLEGLPTRARGCESKYFELGEVGACDVGGDRGRQRRGCGYGDDSRGVARCDRFVAVGAIAGPQGRRVS